MYFTSIALLATVAISETFAASIQHAHLHHRAAQPLEPTVSKRGLLSDVGSSLLSAVGALTGQNSQTNNGQVWIGSDGDYTNEFSNDSGEDLVLVVWGSAGSWVNANKPLVTVSMSSGDSTTVSFASGQSGGWAAVKQDTKLINGQVSNTWGEYTMGPGGVFDVSREVNMNGDSMSIQGSNCTSDMNTCVFVCDDASGTCGTSGSYTLKNCGGSGATNGESEGNASGGCSVSNSLKTRLE